MKTSFIKVAVFSDVILVPKYHGYEGETIKLQPYYIVYIIFKKL